MKWGRGLRAVFLKSDVEVAAEKTEAAAQEATTAMERIKAASREVRKTVGEVIHRVEESRS